MCIARTVIGLCLLVTVVAAADNCDTLDNCATECAAVIQRFAGGTNMVESYLIMAPDIDDVNRWLRFYLNYAYGTVDYFERHLQRLTNFIKAKCGKRPASSCVPRIDLARFKAHLTALQSGTYVWAMIDFASPIIQRLTRHSSAPTGEFVPNQDRSK